METNLIDRSIDINGLIYRINDLWYAEYGCCWVLEVYGEDNAAHHVDLDRSEYIKIWTHYQEFTLDSPTSVIYEHINRHMPC